VAGQSVVKLYAAAMLPGFLLAFLYLIYIVGWAMIQPKIAPPLPEEQNRVPVPPWLEKLQAAYSPNMFFALVQALAAPAKARKIEADGKPLNLWTLIQNVAIALVPFALIAGTLWLVYWYVIVHQQAAAEAAYSGVQQLGAPAQEA